MRHGVGIAPEILRHNKRAVRCDQKFGCLLQSGWIGLHFRRRRRRSRQPRGGLERLAEPFSWQGEIHRPARLAHGDVESALHHRGDILIRSKLVVPFDELAD